MTVADAFNLAVQQHRSGKLTEAESLYRQILNAQPNHSGALHRLGLLCTQVGRHDLAVNLITQAIAFDPNVADYHVNLGVALDALGRVDQAIDSYRRALAIKPDHAMAFSNMGVALQKNGKFPEAIESFRRAAEILPNSIQAISNLGSALQELGRIDESVACYERALKIDPRHAGTINNLGKAWQAAGRADLAIVFFNQALAIFPSSFTLASNAFFAEYYLDHDPHELLAKMKAWSSRHADPLESKKPFASSRDPDRRLRIGFLSADFREHVVGWSLFNLLSHYDRANFETFCYSAGGLADGMTEMLKTKSEHWKLIDGMNDDQAAETIRADQIDVLVDLSLHTSGNRLGVIARRAAPVQATYLGHLGTSGLAAMDYRFSDPFIDAIDFDVTSYSEQTIRLPRSYWCYRPGGDAPEVAPSPAIANGYVTFGCLTTFAKVSPHVLELWSRLLAEIPDSRLILHCPIGSHRAEVLRPFTSRGIAENRIDFIARQTWLDYAKTYHRIDVCLDPFPWGGGITTCDCLWMGVPVVTLAGRTVVGRGGLSILSNVGLPELVARTPDQYVSIARNWRPLIDLRATMRQRMLNSPLMDAQSFARDFEAALRQTWRNWCSTQ